MQYVTLYYYFGDQGIIIHHIQNYLITSLIKKIEEEEKKLLPSVKFSHILKPVGICAMHVTTVIISVDFNYQ